MNVLPHKKDYYESYIKSVFILTRWQNSRIH